MLTSSSYKTGNINTLSYWNCRFWRLWVWQSAMTPVKTRSVMQGSFQINIGSLANQLNDLWVSVDVSESLYPYPLRTECSVIIMISSLQYSLKVTLRLPVRVKYGVSFVNSKSDSCSAAVPAVSYVITWYIELHCNGIQLYLETYCSQIDIYAFVR